MDGDIIIFEKVVHDTIYDISNCQDYLIDLRNYMEIRFIDKEVPSDHGVVTRISQRLNYDQMVDAIGRLINYDPRKLLITRCL